jgi:hypothetical protein
MKGATQLTTDVAEENDGTSMGGQNPGGLKKRNNKTALRSE